MFRYLLSVGLICFVSFALHRNLMLKVQQKRSRRLERHRANLGRENRLNIGLLRWSNSCNEWHILNRVQKSSRLCRRKLQHSTRWKELYEHDQTWCWCKKKKILSVLLKCVFCYWIKVQVTFFVEKFVISLFIDSFGIIIMWKPIFAGERTQPAPCFLSTSIRKHLVLYLGYIKLDEHCST